MKIRAQFADSRILILAPTGNDAEQISYVLNQAELDNEVIVDLEYLCQELLRGVGAILFAEEALNKQTVTGFLNELNQQSKWSDIPLLIMTSQSDSHTSGQQLLDIFEQSGNVTLLERPLKPWTLVSALRVALRARMRQYEVRDLLAEKNNLYQKAEEAIRARDEFLSIASHELKTPVTSLKLQLQMTRRRIDPDKNLSPPLDKLARFLDISSQQVERLTVLIEDLLDVARIQAGKIDYHFEAFNLTDLIHEVIEHFCDQLEVAKCPIELELEPALIVKWDRSRIEQVLVNLISNAIKYAPGKQIIIRSRLDQKNVLLTVQDHGPGIPKDRQGRIFERFERATNSRNISGLGLGLYIVYQIALGHNGTIQVESEENYGTRFILSLPTRPIQALTSARVR